MNAPLADADVDQNDRNRNRCAARCSAWWLRVLSWKFGDLISLSTRDVQALSITLLVLILFSVGFAVYQVYQYVDGWNQLTSSYDQVNFPGQRMNLSFTLVPMTDTDAFNCTFNPKENLSVKITHKTYMDVPVDWEKVKDAGHIDKSSEDGFGALFGKVRLPFDFGFDTTFDPPLVHGKYPTKDTDYAKFYHHGDSFNRIMCYDCDPGDKNCNEEQHLDERNWTECPETFNQVYIRPDTLLHLATCRDIAGSLLKAQNSWFIVPNLIDDKTTLEAYLKSHHIAFDQHTKLVCNKTGIVCTPISWFFANAYPHGVFVSANVSAVRNTQVLRFAQLQTNTTLPSWLPWKPNKKTTMKTMITIAPLHAGSDIYEEEQAGIVLTADSILQQRVLFPGITLSSAFFEWMNTCNTVAGRVIGFLFMTSLGVPIYSRWSGWGKAYYATAHVSAATHLENLDNQRVQSLPAA